MQTKTLAIREEISKVIVGKDEVIAKVLMAILSGGHVLLDDVPGVGKTTLALSFSKALGLDYKRIQFTPDTLPSDITGFSLYNKEKETFVYQPGPVMTNLLLADEINRTSSKTQAALLEVMQERRVTVDGVTYDVPEPFVVLATQNPVGSAGTQLLPTSQMDRFMIRLEMGYPDFNSQVNILKDRHSANPLDEVKPIVSREQLIQMQHEVNEVMIDDAIYEYVTYLAEATRHHELIDLGMSPRGALAVCQFAKAAAYLQKRNYVIPQDVQNIFVDVTVHRLVLSRKARISNYSGAAIVNSILESVAMPAITGV
ncbi:MAG: AAA family ATPase [Fastidiosipilaceae bacterium]